MENPSPRPRTKNEAAMRRLQAVLRQEIKRRGLDCRYAARCPVAKAGNCPGIC